MAAVGASPQVEVAARGKQEGDERQGAKLAGGDAGDADAEEGGDVLREDEVDLRVGGLGNGLGGAQEALGEALPRDGGVPLVRQDARGGGHRGRGGDGRARLAADEGEGGHGLVPGGGVRGGGVKFGKCGLYLEEDFFWLWGACVCVCSTRGLETGEFVVTGLDQ